MNWKWLIHLMHTYTEMFVVYPKWIFLVHLLIFLLSLSKTSLYEVVSPLSFILINNNLYISYPYTLSRLVLFIHLLYWWQINTYFVFETTLLLLLWHSFYWHQGKKVSQNLVKKYWYTMSACCWHSDNAWEQID